MPKIDFSIDTDNPDPNQEGKPKAKVEISLNEDEMNRLAQMAHTASGLLSNFVKVRPKKAIDEAERRE